MKTFNVTTDTEVLRFPFSADRLIGSIVDVICTIDEQGLFHFVSPSIVDLLGYRPDEMIGKSFLNFIFPEDIDKTVQVVQDHTPSCSTSNFENRYIKKDGSIADIIWSARWDEEEGLLYCVARDGSSKKEIDIRLEKAQHMARLINIDYDAVNDCFTFVSDLFYKICGLNKVEYPVITPQLLWDLIHPDDKEWLKKHFFVKHPQLNHHEYRLIKPDGHIIYISHTRELILNSDGQHIKSIESLQDITDRKITEIAVQQSEHRFKSLVQNGSDLIGIIDIDCNYMYVAESVKHILGFDPEFFMGKNAFDFIHPDDQEAVQSNLAEVSDKRYFNIMPFRFRNNAGNWRWIDTNVANYLDNPAINGLIINSRDITERKKAEAELALNEQKFKSVVQNGSDIIVIMEADGTFKYISENVLNILGYEPASLINVNAFDLIHPDDVKDVHEELEKVIQNEVDAKGTIHRFLKQDGEWLWLESKGTNHLDNPAIEGVVINSRNVTERILLQKKLDQELINKQKEITSAVIKAQEVERSQLGLELHDNVNQVLTTIKLYNEMYLTGYYEDKELLKKSTQYLQDCINEIRSISKRLSAPTLGNISLEDSIKELVESINLTNRIEIQYIHENISNVYFEQDIHLAIYRIVQEGLNNIIKYAQASNATIKISNTGLKLCVLIQDNGKGFDINKKREGIGITNMRTRAENLNGSFVLKSAPQQGCSIEICFPFHSKHHQEQDLNFF